MKKLLTLAVVLVFPLLAFGASSDVVLTPSGTLYRIESVDVEQMEAMPSDAIAALRLTVRTPAETQALFVPGTIGGGAHFNASLAYDDTTDTLFVFWVRMPNMMSTELLFTSFHEGFWTEPVSIDNAIFHYRTNLRIGLTRWARETLEDGSIVKVPALAVHAIWWDESGQGQGARYALIGIRDGSVMSVVMNYLTSYVDPMAGPAEPVILDPAFNRDLLRHPSISVHPGGDGVDIIFADWTTNLFHVIELEPVQLQGVLEVPIGFAPGETLGPPAKFSAATIDDIETMHGDQPGELMFYFRDAAGSLRFLSHRKGVWSDLKTLVLDQTLSYEKAVGALERMMKRN